MRIVSQTLAAQDILTIGNSRTFKIDLAQDAGPCGLNFTSALVRADGVPMTLAEVQSGSTLSQTKTQLSLYYGVPESAVELNVVQVDGVYSVQTVVRAVHPVTVQTLQQRFEEAPPTLDVASVVLKLPFQMQDMDIEFASVPVVHGVSLPNAVSIESDLVYSDGTPLSDSEVAQASDTLIWQMSQFYGVDTSLVEIQIIPPRNPAVSNASSVRVVILSGAQAVDDVFQRAEQMTATAEVRVVPVAIAGLNNAQTTVLQGQMVAGRFEECPANYRVYGGQTDQNLARSCGASGNEFCQASSTSYSTDGGVQYGPQLANDGVIGYDGEDNPGYLRFMSAWSPGRTEWWQVDLSGQREVKSVTIYAWMQNAVLLENFDLQLSNDGITFTNCAAGQDASQQYSPWRPPFISTHSCLGSARYVRLSIYVPDDFFLQLLEVQVYGEAAPGTCSSRCLCDAGYTGLLDMPCEACGVGKYKNTTSADACGECAAGSFTGANGSTGCALCPENTFSDAPGTATCSACPSLTQSAVGGSSVSDCQCVAGYTGAGGLETCSPCVAGTFKTDAGSGACSACPTRTFFSGRGASSSAACTPCHPNATSAE